MAPESIAVVGASPKGNRGTQILRNLERFGFPGSVYALHPTADEVEGVACYPSLRDLPEPVEFVAVAVGAEAAPDILAEAAALGSHAGLVIAGGFGEGPGTGATRRDRLVEVCRSADLQVCGPNCYGILNAHSGLAAYSGAVVDPLQPGNVSFVFQSGAITHSLHDSSVERGLGIATVVTSGNEAVVGMHHYLEWLAEDDDTDVIALFIEGIRNAEGFAAAARRAHRRDKALVALKVGGSSKGQRATRAHTGAVAGADAAYDGFFRRHGVIRVHDIDELRETLLLLSSVPPPRGDGGVAIASISGGATSLLADHGELLGLPTPDPAPEAADRLRALLPEFGTPSNPLDMTGALAERPGILHETVTAFSADPAIAAFALAFNVTRGSTGQEDFYRSHAHLFAEARALTDKPLVAFSVASGPVDPGIRQPLAAAGIPFLMGARESVLAMSHWLCPPPPAEGAAGDEPDRARVAPPGWDGADVLGGGAALDLLAGAGITVVPFRLAGSADEAVRAADDLGYPVVLKVESAQLTHKSDIGGVRLALGDAGAVRRAYDDLRGVASDARLQFDGVMVQQYISGGRECLLGVTRDPQLGLQLAVAPGGVLVELLGSVASRPVPVRRLDVEDLIDSGLLGRLLQGYRGQGPADRTALVEAALRLSTLAAALGDSLQEADVNPLLVLPDGHGVAAVDALFVRGSAERSSP